ncbi:YolD-like family protein [Bacillus subtilis]|nr:YolD-like family protein [Bacillus subtilis]
MHYLAEHQTFDSTAQLNEAVYEHIKRNTYELNDGYIREVIGAVHYVDHIRKKFRVKDAKGDTNFVRFADIINVKNAPSG